MYICFAEYRIASEYREAYLELAGRYLSGREDMYLYEGTDQINLFVEVWQAGTEVEAEKIKEERLNGHSSLAQITEWIPGGAAKLHVWTFKPALTK